jgi:hypothetical protein
VEEPSRELRYELDERMRSLSWSSVFRHLVPRKSRLCYPTVSHSAPTPHGQSPVRKHETERAAHFAQRARFWTRILRYRCA